VLWNMVLRNAFSINGYAGCFLVYVIFAAWAVLTLSILGKEGGGVTYYQCCGSRIWAFFTLDPRSGKGFFWTHIFYA
jgi:hypothetical protein